MKLFFVARTPERTIFASNLRSARKRIVGDVSFSRISIRFTMFYLLKNENKILIRVEDESSRGRTENGETVELRYFTVL